MASSEPDLLALLDRHTELLDRTVAGLDDLGAPSLCAGWTRGHVVTHLARNAEAIGRLVRAAVDGTGDTMYASSADRDAEIEAGAGRDLESQREDLLRTAAAVRADLGRLRPEHAGRLLERTPGVVLVASEDLPYMRLREVVIHHVDLDAGFGFADLEPELLALLIDRKVGLLRRDDDVPDMTLRSAEGDEWSLGAGTVEVRGSRAGLLAWLTRGHTAGVTADPLPHLQQVG
ncbi:maleylpyruvate isomerase family mycothiol-dependent enzyme [uncultured Phycicoccus sp.]|uniref:maleylpyruvate isomerase family mycothiol-dependent enzyme n=1 Tax=uncultured Phycicoccus sp. TaxID=661422 RepID=UPI002614BB42|nr:maleylpyruvate isomerase family mycothiol-dependent enzyme [uncultured Phycicoccus sp.]